QRMTAGNRTRRDMASSYAVALHLDFGLEVRPVAADRGDGQPPPLVGEADRRIVRVERAVDAYVVPVLGVADVADGHVVVLAPEERHGVERLVAAQDVPRRRLSLALR